jgi:hypothetical protein
MYSVLLLTQFYNVYDATQDYTKEIIYDSKGAIQPLRW